MNKTPNLVIPAFNNAFILKIVAMFAKEVEQIVVFDFFSEKDDRILSDYDILKINQGLRFRDPRLSFYRKNNYSLSHAREFPVYTASRKLILP